jgi:hypothetical protein
VPTSPRQKDQIGKVHLEKYEKMRLRYEASQNSHLNYKALKRMTHDCKPLDLCFTFYVDMQWMAEQHGAEVVIPVFHLRIKQMAQQLLMNEVEMAYWHALNIARDELWQQQPKAVMEQLLINALFAKSHCVSEEEAEVFQTFIEHNYQMHVNLVPPNLADTKIGDQQNWTKVYSTGVSTGYN